MGTLRALAMSAVTSAWPAAIRAASSAQLEDHAEQDVGNTGVPGEEAHDLDEVAGHRNRRKPVGNRHLVA